MPYLGWLACVLVLQMTEACLGVHSVQEGTERERAAPRHAPRGQWGPWRRGWQRRGRPHYLEHGEGRQHGP